MVKLFWKVCQSFVGGFVEAATFVAAVGIFSSDVAQNIILLASDITKGFQTADILKLLVFPTYIFAVVTTVLLNKYWKATKQFEIESKMMGIVSILLMLSASISYVTFKTPATPNSISISQSLLLLIVVYAMGIMNSVYWQGSSTSIGPSLMTGNIARVTVEYIKLQQDEKSFSHEVERKRVKELLLSIVSFVLGSLFGAFFTSYKGLTSLIIPSIVMLIAIHTRQAGQVNFSSSLKFGE